MPSLAEQVATDLDALADYLATTEGLREVDGVTILDAAYEELPAADVVVFGDVTIPQGRPGLVVREGTPTLNGWVVVQRPEGGKTAIRACRRVAAQHMGRVEAAVVAVNADPIAAGLGALAGSFRVSTSGIQGSPSIWQGQAVRQTQIAFSVTWTSHSA